LKIHNLSISYNPIDRYAAIEYFKDFAALPDKKQAWDDLHRLVNDEDSTVRFEASHALSSAFSHLPDKQQAWNDLIKLTSDEVWLMRTIAANTIGFAASQVPDKQQAWNDLQTLANDEDNNVRTYAKYSLGKLSVFQASLAENEEDYKRELEKAIEFFEKAAEDSKYTNPSQFCLPFYRSFYTIVFKKLEAKEEVNKYLAEAKNAVKGSKSKELLFKAVENLANALKEVQSLENLDLEAKKDELNFYRIFCDRAAELLRDTDEMAPYATELVRKGLPILDRNLKELLKEIREKARTACKELQGTPKAEVACSIYRKAKELEISNSEELAQGIEDIAYTLSCQVSDTPENKYILSKFDQISSETDLTKKIQILSYVTEHVIGQMLRDNKNLNDSIVNVNTKITDTKKPFIKKITSAIVASLGIAGTFFALSYPVCEMYNLGNQDYIYIGVFVISFLFSIPIVFLIIEK
jgi:HEAT repeat protein